ncbi:MAG: sulfatase-like hydrolase/transferase, partial [Bacteroides sp.]|nr:sulfatase-like hydrolase/transferase [Bacteroides sp.]
MKKTKYFAGIGMAALAALPALAQQKERPNVIIIYADDLGYGDLECYGAKNVKTPNVNRLAANGIQFTNTHAVASTSTP